MTRPSPRVFTIPASAPFLTTLVGALVDGRLVPGFPGARDPLALAAATLYLPTRRACRLARDVFLDVLGNEAAILPRIVPLGDIDEDEIAFAEAAASELAEQVLELPPAVGGLQRRLLLARLVMKWATRLDPAGDDAPLITHSPAAALALADDLARLMDDMTTRQVSWDRLDGLVPEELDRYWQLTLEFLKIARENWPKILAERGAIEAAERRDRLIAAEAARIARMDAPVIAAGSTGSMPATASLLATIAQLPRGAVVLPGLDTDLDDEAWNAIGSGGDEPAAAGHPQFAMQALLQRIGITRELVAALAAPAAHGRERLVSEALRPAASTDRWPQRLAEPAFAAHAIQAIGSLTLVEAANPDEEALAIAIALRETVETEEQIAALVTPDRALARRVIAALARWHVPVEDSAGDALIDTEAGCFAQLIVETVQSGFAPVPLLALLKHKLFRLGAHADGNLPAVSALERAILRGPRPRSGTAGLAAALAAFRAERAGMHRSDPRHFIREPDLDTADELVVRLAAAVAPLETIGSGPRPLSEITACHRDAIAALSTDKTGMVAAFSSADGTALAGAFDDLLDEEVERFPVGAADYPDLFRTLIAGRMVRPPPQTGVRVRIFGLLESRLQYVDRLVLGGLVEETWPPETRSDPWLSRPMRQAIGLDPPERRIGLSAHDFAQALGAPEIILTRSAKLKGAPTVSSRFVQRLAAVAGPKLWDDARGRGADYLNWARELDRPAKVKSAPRPAPKPARDVRPSALAVTDIEDWLRDPYTIYAKHILRLPAFDPVDTAPGAADRGTLIHGAIGDFTKKFAAALPDNIVAELTALGTRYFAPLEDYPEARAFWWPRFQRIARWFSEWEQRRRPTLTALHAEIRGEIKIPVGQRTFKLSARADRIERAVDGRYAVLDYKTGSARTEKQVRSGLAPQLTLEAAILRGGGFSGIAAGASVAELTYVVLKGGEPAGNPCEIEFKEGTPDSQADRALARLTDIVRKFEEVTQPYRSLVHPMWKTNYGEYDHLARVKEWSATGGEVDPEGFE